jgi:rod shape-determining protein MreD
MSSTRANRFQLFLVLALLALLHFYVRPRLWSARISPDFLLVALMLYAMRSRPGAGAGAGLVVGLVVDAMTPARFGAGIVAHAVVGYLAAWSRAVFFADNVVVYAGFLAVGLWLRDLLVLVLSGVGRAQLAQELMVYAPLQALVTAVFGVLVLLAFREWFSIRLDA